jgi:hypothetical protein
MAIVGIAFLIFAGLLFAFKLVIAYDADGSAPTLDGAIFPPIFAAFGLRLLVPGWSAWAHAGAWLALTILALATLLLAGKLGARRAP